MKKCPECLGKGEIYCSVCKGAKKHPQNPNKTCDYCNGEGIIKCNLCLGKGQVDDSIANDFRR